MLRNRFADLAASLRDWPSLAGWGRAGLELVWAVPLMLVLAHLGGLVRWEGPPDLNTSLRLAASLFIVPALGEELLFRGLVIPRTRPGPRWLALSAALFVLWHPLQALTIGPPWAAAFIDPWFLAATAILGTALARIYAATGSLWPCIAAHWLIVLSWKTLLGGPF
jgi:uncharacterized protein